MLIASSTFSFPYNSQTDTLIPYSVTIPNTLRIVHHYHYRYHHCHLIYFQFVKFSKLESTWMVRECSPLIFNNSPRFFFFSVFHYWFIEFRHSKRSICVATVEPEWIVLVFLSLLRCPFYCLLIPIQLEMKNKELFPTMQYYNAFINTQFFG